MQDLVVPIVMYHQAHDHLPLVDGYVPFDFRLISLMMERVKLEPKEIPQMSDEEYDNLKY